MFVVRINSFPMRRNQKTSQHKDFLRTIMKGIIAAVSFLLVSAIPALAIEGLQISLQCSNVILSWPSQNGETYIVQYRPDLVSTNSWVTLTNYMPNDNGTNITIFGSSTFVMGNKCIEGKSGGGTDEPAHRLGERDLHGER